MNAPGAFPREGPLLWTQPKAMRREYQLANGDEIIGWLRFEQTFGSLASAEVTSQNWTFKKQGFLHPRIAVRIPSSDANLAVFRRNWSGSGALEYPDGRQIHWRHTSFWKPEWVFVQGEDRPLLRFKQRLGLMKISARVEFDPADAAVPDLPMLAALGWYLLLLAAQAAAAAAVMVAATG
jgi:hypothetical protein